MRARFEPVVIVLHPNMSGELWLLSKELPELTVQPDLNLNPNRFNFTKFFGFTGISGCNNSIRPGLGFDKTSNYSSLSPDFNLFQRTIFEIF